MPTNAVNRAALLSWAAHHRNIAPPWVDRLTPNEAYHLGQAEKALALVKAITDGEFDIDVSGAPNAD